MIEIDIVNLIGTLGFPIAVSVYLLWERNTATKENTKAITELKNLISILCEKLSK